MPFDGLLKKLGIDRNRAAQASELPEQQWTPDQQMKAEAVTRGMFPEKQKAMFPEKLQNSRVIQMFKEGLKEIPTVFVDDELERMKRIQDSAAGRG